VAAARRRNLAVGFGILLLLGLSVGLLVTVARRAERLARQQVEFVAGVTHELRTPLAVIRSAGENLADGLVADPAQVRSYGGLVRDEGRRLSELVEQVLELAGATSARGAVRRPVSLPKVVAEALRSVEIERAAAGVTVDADVPSDLPPVAGDEAALVRAVHNLLDNAVKYAGEPRWVGVRARAAGGRVELAIEDRGLGIAEQEQALIFEPFFRGEEAVSRQIRGTGLGLSLVRRIVEAHRGSIAVASAGVGARFVVTLPVADAPEPAGGVS
jgi:signal transduction histidine kinase